MSDINGSVRLLFMTKILHRFNDRTKHVKVVPKVHATLHITIRKRIKIIFIGQISSVMILVSFFNFIFYFDIIVLKKKSH